ncbi:MAG: hypothetical protein AMS21_00710 [Gemmatimonas sp. SG8_38_2]|nr:MAG: hypothetical protein AMS21_00710 [Gemmatimonas sp. SG8_38_2]
MAVFDKEFYTSFTYGPRIVNGMVQRRRGGPLVPVHQANLESVMISGLGAVTTGVHGGAPKNAKEAILAALKTRRSEVMPSEAVVQAIADSMDPFAPDFDMKLDAFLAILTPELKMAATEKVTMSDAISRTIIKFRSMHGQPKQNGFDFNKLIKPMIAVVVLFAIIRFFSK